MFPFRSRKIAPYLVDIHSHLVPGIDDGSQNVDQSIELIRTLMEQGVKKIITTPHIHPRYPNTPEQIMDGLTKVQKGLEKQSLEIEIEAAAEYYVDESFVSRIKSGEPLLSFGNRYVLVESPFQNKPAYFESTMFDLQAAGYNPILAHPERYKFLEGSIDWLRDLHQSGVLMQVTIGSVAGYYGSIPAKASVELLKLGLVDFLGSDLHGVRHVDSLAKGLRSKPIQRAITSGAVKNVDLL